MPRIRTQWHEISDARPRLPISLGQDAFELLSHTQLLCPTAEIRLVEPPLCEKHVLDIHQVAWSAGNQFQQDQVLGTNEPTWRTTLCGRSP